MGHFNATFKLQPGQHRRPVPIGPAPQLPPESLKSDEPMHGVMLPPPKAPRPPPEKPIDRLWRSIVSLGIGWFDGDVSHMTLWYRLSERYAVDEHPDEALRVRFSHDARTVVAPLYTSTTQPQGLVFVHKDVFYVRVQFLTRVVGWLETDHENVRVELARRTRPLGKARPVGSSIILVPERAGKVRVF